MRAAAATGLLTMLLALLVVPLLALTASPASAQEDGELVSGRLVQAREPVEGVTITLEDASGETVAESESDENGRFSLEVPEPGEYEAVLDVDSLPDGVALRQEGGERRPVVVVEGRDSPVLFALGEGSTGGRGTAGQAAQLLVGGLQFGLVIGMAAIGLSLIFGTTGLTNFAHGELVAGGAILAYVFNSTGMNLVPATVLAVIGAGLAGYLLDRGLWRPLRNRGTGLIAALVISIGLSLVLRYGYLYFFGGNPRSYEQYATQGPLVLGPIALPPRDLWIMGISLVVLTVVGLALIKTRLGKATRAVADNPALASASGIDVQQVISVVWIAGTALAALGGVFLALSTNVSFLMGANILLLLFAAVTLGGLGTAFGAMVGAMVVGVFTQMSTLIIPTELQNVGALLILILVLILRPQGILGRAERVG